MAIFLLFASLACFSSFSVWSIVPSILGTLVRKFSIYIEKYKKVEKKLNIPLAIRVFFVQLEILWSVVEGLCVYIFVESCIGLQKNSR